MKTHDVSFQDLESGDVFSSRHIGPSSEEQTIMLAELGFNSLNELTDTIVPRSIHRSKVMNLGPGLSETASLNRLKDMASKNRVLKSFIGLGYYNTITPPTIQRNIFENPAWYTAYTPYQAEISQGRMEAMLNFQTMVTELTGMELANASMLDEATACAEAMTLCKRMSKNKSNRFFVDRDCHPQNIAVVQTRAKPLGIEVIVGDPLAEFTGDDFFGLLLQYPGSRGEVRDYRQLCEKAHEAKTLVAVAADLLALTLLVPPGHWGADVVVGNTQRFGVPLGYGGPHAAYLATREVFKRSMPGRLIGVSVDSNGKSAYRLALQTREQHIRREKATSNICTAQALLAVMASMYALYHGPDGLRNIALRIHLLTTALADGLRRPDLSGAGVNVETGQFFDTITISCVKAADPVHCTDRIMSAALDRGINFCRRGTKHFSISLDETTLPADLADILAAVYQGAGLASNGTPADSAAGTRVSNSTPADSAGLASTGAGADSVEALLANARITIETALLREDQFMQQEVFNIYHSETALMRYMRFLADKDLALDRAMIPLGSCTMKLNAVSELMPVSWPEFASMHPYAPVDQAEGYTQLIGELEAMLCEATGYAAVSLQPNSGAQGEYAGLLAIRAYHESRGEAHRDVCLIPASAHGTNPASAQMAGLKVVVVSTDDGGNISIDDLKAKIAEHGDALAAIMITYPSTHGVFEESVVEVCDLVHQAGGQVYIDGANMNAMVGLCAPGHFGGDVSHLNLHKTFAIPHGGGGPGVGPIAVAGYLKDFLPGHALNDCEPGPVGPVSSAPWGSAGILPISWAYISMMGSEGLTRATQVAILNANYVARRLKDSYPLLYSDKKGFIAHECIIDLRSIKYDTGITVDDFAKRLIDYGFHAPTMSFPVPGTLMIEPTESESKYELDRFIDAMIAIKAEVDMVASGQLDASDNPLVNSPHTVDVLSADEWNHSYSRNLAAYPVESLRRVKYWPPVGRVDNAYGDKNLVCTCPPLSAYASESGVDLS